MSLPAGIDAARRDGPWRLWRVFGDWRGRTLYRDLAWVAPDGSAAVSVRAWGGGAWDDSELAWTVLDLTDGAPRAHGRVSLSQDPVVELCFDDDGAAVRVLDGGDRVMRVAFARGAVTPGFAPRRWDLDRARVEFESSQQDVVHAEAELERARGHLELLGLAPDKLDYDAPVFIRAPESGVIMQRQITTGASVNPGDHLFTISELGQLWVLAEVEEKRLAQLRVGAPVTIEVAAFPGQGFPGKIARISDVLNPQTRMIEVRCLVDNRSGRLKPEMYAVTRIAAGEKTQALVVPKAAIQDVGGQSVVFVAREGQSYQKKIVRLGREDGDQVEILEGLKAGEKVVSTGGFLLKSELQKSQME